MLSKLSLIPIYAMTFIYTCADEVADVFTNTKDVTKVVNFIPKTENLENAAQISTNSEPNLQFKICKSDSHIRILNWKLHKNLETLVFLRELESRYEKANGISTVIKEYYEIKEEVQRNTIEIAHKLSYCKFMRAKSA